MQFSPTMRSIVPAQLLWMPVASVMYRSSLGTITLKATLQEPALTIKSFAGGTAATAFIDPETANLWPQATSVLLGKGALAYSPAIDFNNTSRIDPIDVGAYETNGLLTNPGWQIQQGFKGTAGSDTIAPTVSITNPANGSTVARKSTVSITASASDNIGIIRVEFYVNGALQCTDSQAPYGCSWKVPNNGSIKNYRLDAKAYDAANNVGTATLTVKTR